MLQILCSTKLCFDNFLKFLVQIKIFASNKETLKKCVNAFSEKKYEYTEIFHSINHFQASLMRVYLDLLITRSTETIHMIYVLGLDFACAHYSKKPSSSFKKTKISYFCPNMKTHQIP